MKISRILTLACTLVLLAGASFALGAAAGSREDPLISKDYVDGTFTENVLKDARSAIDFTLSKIQNQAQGDDAVPGSTGSFTVKSVSAGSTASLDLGDSVVLLSGAATVQIQSGSLVNVTVGAEAVSGKLLTGNRYLACEDTSAVVTFSQASTVAVDGSVAITGSVLPFTDVTPARWFYSDVVAAVEKGLISGKTPTTYEPDSSLTLAEAVKLAACLHQLYHSGSVSLTNSPTAPWYQSYVDYAMANGILSGGYADYNAAATRRQFVEIFYGAMPESSYTAINSVPDGAIPDVDMSAEAAAEIYAFYRAGILTGSDDAGHFNAGSDIKRSEVAAILTRMYDASARKSFTLGG